MRWPVRQWSSIFLPVMKWLEKDSYRRSLVSAQSARLICGYIYATAGEGESTTDLVFGGQHLIAENGTILAEAKRFENQIICADLDVDRLTSERRRMTTYPEQRTDGYQVVRFSLAIEETKLTRYFDPRPFVPSDKHNRDQRCDEILNIQAMGLKNVWRIPIARAQLSVFPVDLTRRWHCL